VGRYGFTFVDRFLEGRSMTAITFETTICPDGMLHLFVPGALPECRER